VCRAEVTEPAASALARLLTDMCAGLCAADGTAPDSVLVGPVDFGQEPE
jgi:hypothetical protein